MESLYVLRFGGSAAAFVQYIVKIHFLVGFFLVCGFRVIEYQEVGSRQAVEVYLGRVLFFARARNVSARIATAVDVFLRIGELAAVFRE